ncbi:AsmA family protein [Thiomicrorhabdus sediminis]|uniref:AsmA family protein n=1 Tax=Thiomicrorhabdus sediminis TaxID=2580412 RepID=A0A4P9K6H8_9GAMM|nr:AsmA family protein [Thiomicrorhabdus sediminis]QCU89847.1 AsmA family protein [Thiomicrorhabdus sediminis]
MNAASLILKIIAGVFAALIITVIAIITLVDPNDYRDEITNAVKQQTGRDFSVANMSLSIFPKLSIDLEQAKLSNAEGFSETAFVEVDKVQVGAALLPLLSSSLQVDTLTLQGLRINLQKNKEGKTNWDDLIAAKDDEKVSPSDEQKGDPLSALAQLNIGGINIEDGYLLWDDRQTLQKIELTGLSLNTGAITLGEYFTINIAVTSKIQQPRIDNQLSASIEAMLGKNGEYGLRNLQLENRMSGKDFIIQQLTLKAALPEFSLKEDALSIAKATLDYDISLDNTMPITQSSGALTMGPVNGNLKTQQFKIEKLNLQSNLNGEKLDKAPLNLSAQAAIDMQKQTAKIGELKLQAMQVNGTGEIKIAQLTSEPTVHADVNLAETNLRTLLTQLGISLPTMQNKNSLTRFASQMTLDYSTKPQSVKLTKLQVKLDDSTLNGQLSVANFAKPDINFKLGLDKIIVDAYLAPKTKQEKQTPTADPNAKIELPTEMLRSLSIAGELNVKQLQYDKIKATDVVLVTAAKNGLITAKPIRAQAFNTQINASSQLDVRTNTPKYQITTNTANLPIGEVLIAVADTDKLSGKGSVNANLTTSGDSINDFKKALNGSLDLDLKDGAVKGFNLAQSIRNAKAKISGQPAPATNEVQQTDFSSLIGKFTIKNGVVNTEQLSALAPFMRIEGSGTINIPPQTLNYLVKTKIVGSDKGQGGEALQDLNGLTIPVKLNGDLTSPKIALDLNSILEQKTKQQIEQKKEEVVKDLEKQLKENLFKGFKF